MLQLRAVLDGFPVHAAKTGMLFSAGIINALADALRDRSFPLVVDPVSVSQSGSRLLREDAVEALKERMIPGCDLLTPNRPEAEMLTGMTISCADDAAAAGEALIRMGAKAVLIKGGHMESSIVVTDCLCQAGQAPKFLPQPKVTSAVVTLRRRAERPWDVADQDIFGEILNLTQVLNVSDIQVDKINYNSYNEAELVMGDITVELGNSDSLDGKIAELHDIMTELTGLSGTLYLDTYDETNSSPTYRFVKKN